MISIRSALLVNIAQPAGVHYNHCVSPSVRGHLVKMRITLDHMVYIDVMNNKSIV